jgi:hypothetical protein
VDSPYKYAHSRAVKRFRGRMSGVTGGAKTARRRDLMSYVPVLVKRLFASSTKTLERKCRRQRQITSSRICPRRARGWCLANRLFPGMESEGERALPADTRRLPARRVGRAWSRFCDSPRRMKTGQRFSRSRWRRPALHCFFRSLLPTIHG